ncbi:calcium-binding protein [Mariprofundus sp. EBB-1]|uniref:beta strand repeat-containing protein n=1 Tax=Mariprofundus sp. EBB-1 TaxID=2650971 RepID=UPI000EF1B93E|nr:calcium-binding protein [Mariprofundus sp. EBB-1]RLL51276.1 calcium-binding protein [Mariprofundus sp. EBB-1]
MLFSLNDLQGGANAWIDQAIVTAAGAVNVTALENVALSAQLTSNVTATTSLAMGKSLAVNGAIATNTVLSGANAHISNSQITTSGVGALTIDSRDTSSIDAWINATTKSNGVSIGIGLAFNSIGWQSQNFLFSTIDTLIGTSIAVTQPDLITAYMQNSTAMIAGGITVSASSSALIAADIKAASSSFSLNNTAASVGALITKNMLNNQVHAYVDGGNMTSNTGNITIQAMDTSVIRSFTIASSVSATVIGTSPLSLGLSIGRNEITNDVSAYINAATSAQALVGNVMLQANKFATITAKAEAASANVALSGTGGAGAESVNIIDGNADAHITGSLNIAPAAALSLSSSDLSTITSTAGAVAAGGTAGIGASFAWNTITSGSKSFIDASTVHAASVLLAASSTRTIQSLAAAGTAGGKAGVAGAVTLNTIGGFVDAHISGISNITSAVVATLTTSDTSTIKSLAGGFAIGGKAGIAGADATNTITSILTSYVDASVLSAGSVSLSAAVTRNIDSNAVSGSIGGTGSLAGSVTLNTLGGSVDAHISGGSNITSVGTVTLTVNDASIIKSLAGSMTAGGQVGIAGALATNTITSILTSYIDASRLSAGSMSLSAVATRNIESIAASGSAGGAGALAGSVSVNNAGGSVDVHIATGAAITAAGGLTLSANDTSIIRSLAGAVSGGGTIGVGASVTTNDITNSITAYINSSTVIAASVALSAAATRTLESIAVAGSAGGTVGVAGAVTTNNLGGSVDTHVAVGSNLTTTSAISLTATDTSTIRSLAGGAAIGGTAGIAGAVATNNITNLVQSYVDASTLNAASVSISATSTRSIETISAAAAGSLGLGLAGSTTVNGAAGSVDAHITGSSNITSTGLIDVTANQTTNITARSGAAAGGFVGAAASVTTADVTHTVNAYIGAGTTLSAAGNITISATGNVSGIGAETYVGAGGIVGASAAVATFHSINNVSAYMAGDVSRANKLAVLATSSSTVKAIGFGVTVGGVAVGGVVATATETGTTQAYLGNNVVIGDRLAATALRGVNNLTVGAQATVDVNALTTAAAAGIASGSGADAAATATPTVKAYIGTGASIGLIGSHNQYAIALGQARADATGAAAGALAVGASLASATWTGNIDSYIGANTVIVAGGNVSVKAFDNYDVNGLRLAANLNQATTTSVAGALLGGTGASSAVNSSAITKAHVDGGTSLTAGGNIDLLAKSSQRTDAYANGIAIGLLAADGVSIVVNNLTDTTQTFTGAGAIMQATGNVTISGASQLEVFRSDAVGAGGGLLAGMTTDATASLTASLVTTLGSNSNISAGGILTVDALSDIYGRVSSGITAGGLIVDNKVNARLTTGVTTKVDIGTGSSLSGTTVNLDAKVIRLNLSGSAYSKTIAASSTSDAKSILNTTVATDLLLNTSGVVINAANAVNMFATNTGVSVLSLGTARILAGLTGSVFATGHNNAILNANINVLAGTKIYSDRVVVEANSPVETVTSYNKTADAKADTVVKLILTAVEKVVEVARTVVSQVTKWLPWPLDAIVETVTTVVFDQVIKTFMEWVATAFNSVVTPTLAGTFSSNSSVNLNGDIYQGGISTPTLTINADGSITKAGQITATTVGNDVFVDAINVGNPGEIIVNSLDAGLITGNVIVHKNNVFESVTITNNSNKRLIVGTIQTYNPNPPGPALAANAGSGTNTLNTTYITDSTNPRAITIQGNTASDILFAGVANTLGYITTVGDTGGNILGQTGGLIKATALSMTTNTGSIGTLVNKVAVDFHHLAGTNSKPNLNPNPQLNLSSAQNVVMDMGLKQSLTTAPAAGYAISALDINSITAGGDITLTGLQPELTTIITTSTPQLVQVKDSLGNQMMQQRLDAAGNPVLDPLTGNPVLEPVPDAIINVASTTTAVGAQPGIYNLHNISSANGSVNASMISGNINVGLINASIGTVSLRASGSIADMQLDDLAPVSNINANSVMLTAGTIGQAGNYLEVDSAQTGTVSAAVTTGDMFINELVGDMTVGTISAGAGAVNLTAAGSLLDRVGSSLSGGTVNLTSRSGTIGTAANLLDIDSTVLSATAATDAFLNETTGDMNINTVIASAGSVTLQTTAGSMLDANNNGLSNINGAQLFMTANGGSIGTATNLLDIDSTALPTAVTATGATGVYLNETAGELNVQTATAMTGNIILATTDAATAGQNINVNATTQINAVAGNVSLNGGDNITVAVGGLVKAAGVIAFNADLVADADVGTGAVVTIDGVLSAPSVVINTGSDDDAVYINSVANTALLAVNSGAGDDLIDVSAPSAVTTLDGQDGQDLYNLWLPASGNVIVNVDDSGVIATGVDALNIFGRDVADDFLFRAGAITSLSKSALIVASFDQAERVNYTSNVESISVFGRNGNDNFMFDDTSSAVTVYGDAGDDTFQVGQVFKSQRDAAAGLAMADQFNTTLTTAGYLSNGISLPATLYGGIGNDAFTVNHNKAALSVFGEDGSDSFAVHAFVKVNPGDPVGPYTNINGGQGADFISYAVNAPVAISGGDGFDTLTVVGTDSGDDFVVAADGVFGAGLFVSYGGIERVVVDAGAGNDRFYIASSDPNIDIQLLGGLGSDTFNVSGGTAPGQPISLVSNALQGHSGLINHAVTSVDAVFNNIFAENIVAKVADSSAPEVVITPVTGPLRVFEEQLNAPTAAPFVSNRYQVVLSSAPTETVVVNALPVVPRVGAGVMVGTTPANMNATGTQLTFTVANWYIPQTVTVTGINDALAEGTQFLDIRHTVSSATPEGAYDNINVRNLTVEVVDNNLPGIVVAQTNNQSMVAEAGAYAAVDSYQMVMTQAPTGNVTVAIGVDGQLQLFADAALTQPISTLTFTTGTWMTAQTVYIKAVADGVAEGTHYSRITHTVSSGQPMTVGSIDVTVLDNSPGVVIHQSGGTTNVTEFDAAVVPPANQVRDQYDVVLTAAPTADVFVNATPELTRTYNAALAFDAAANNGERIAKQVVVASHIAKMDMAGPVMAGDVWILTLNATPYSYTAGTDPLLPLSLQGIADGLMANLPVGYTALFDAAANVLTIENAAAIFTTAMTAPLTASVGVRQGVLFTTLNWDTAQQVTVTAINDKVVDGSDALVFAEMPGKINLIRGPINIDAGAGNATSVTTAAPFMLIGETNEYKPAGSASAIATDINGNATLTDIAITSSDPAAVVGTLEFDQRMNSNPYEFRILSGAAVGTVMQVLSVTGQTVTFKTPWPIDLLTGLPLVPAIGDTYTYAAVNANTTVIESNQVDAINVFNQNSIANAAGTLTGTRLFGFGMGPDSLIGGQLINGGISYSNVESFNLQLGSGNDILAIDSTMTGSTSVNTGGGNDTINAKMISGHTTVSTGSGVNTVNVGSDKQVVDQITALLTVVGDGFSATDTLNINDSGDTNNNTGYLTSSTLTGLDMPTVREVQTILVSGVTGDFTLNIAGMVSSILTYGMTALQVQTAVQTLYGDVNNEISVIKEGDLYSVFFGGALAGLNQPQMSIGDVSLVANLNATPQLVTATLQDGTLTPALNVVQTLAMNAIAGSFTLSLLGQITAAIAYNASAADLQAALDPVLNPNNSNPSLPYTNNVVVSKYGEVFQITFQGEHKGLRLTAADVNGAGLTAGTTLSDGTLAGGGAISLQTRTDGMNYYNIDTMNIDLGSGADVFNVQGTSAVTNLNSQAGNDTINVSSQAPANLGDIHISAHAPNLPGILDLVQGTLNINAGAGNNLLQISDQGSLIGDAAVLISSNLIRGLAPADIRYTASGGSFSPDINIWTGQGNDTITVESVRSEAITSLMTGAGDDSVTVAATHTAGQLVVDGEAGNDTINAAATSATMVLIGGVGADTITGGVAADTIFGDDAHVVHNHITARPTIDRVESINTTQGGSDTISGGAGGDAIFGGFGNDMLNADAGNDIIMGENGVQVRNDGSLQANDIYAIDSTVFGADTINGGLGNDIIIGDFAYITRDANRQVQHITSLFTAFGGNDTVNAGNGNNIVFGGAGNDTISSGAGNDIIFGDNGIITYAGATPGTISTLDPAIGGDDTIVSGAGNDIVFGGWGMDAISGQAGNDILIGDSAKVIITGNQTVIQTTDYYIGQNDWISGGIGNNMMFGGFGTRDILVGTLASDVMMGDNGRAVLLNGMAQSILSYSVVVLDQISVVMANLYGSSLLSPSSWQLPAVIPTYNGPDLSNTDIKQITASSYGRAHRTYSHSQTDSIQPTSVGEDDGSLPAEQHTVPDEPVLLPQELNLLPEDPDALPEGVIILENSGNLPVVAPDQLEHDQPLEDENKLLDGDAKNDELLGVGLIALAGWQMNRNSSMMQEDALKKQKSRKIRW